MTEKSVESQFDALRECVEEFLVEADTLGPPYPVQAVIAAVLDAVAEGIAQLDDLNDAYAVLNRLRGDGA